MVVTEPRNSHYGINYILLLAIMALIYIYSLQNLVKKNRKLLRRKFKIEQQKEWELIGKREFEKGNGGFTSVMLVETDLEHNIISAPKLFYSILGFDEEDILGVNIHQLLQTKSVIKDKEIKNELMNKEFPYLDAEYEFKVVLIFQFGWIAASQYYMMKRKGLKALSNFCVM